MDFRMDGVKQNCTIKMNDHTIMFFGVHKGKKLANVPAEYLLFLYKENKCFGELKKYIEDNMDGLKQETLRNGKKIY